MRLKNERAIKWIRERIAFINDALKQTELKSSEVNDFKTEKDALEIANSAIQRQSAATAIQPSEDVTMGYACPRCGHHFIDKPFFCHYCGQHIKYDKPLKQGDAKHTVTSLSCNVSVNYDPDTEERTLTIEIGTTTISINADNIATSMNTLNESIQNSTEVEGYGVAYDDIATVDYSEFN